jgi:hypothetical protein
MPRIYNGERSVSWTNGIGKTGFPHVKIKLDPYFITHTYTPHTHLKWTKDLKSEASKWPEKPLEENTGGKHCDIDLANDFLDVTPKAQPTEAKK